MRQTMSRASAACLAKAAARWNPPLRTAPPSCPTATAKPGGGAGSTRWARRAGSSSSALPGAGRLGICQRPPGGGTRAVVGERGNDRRSRAGRADVDWAGTRIAGARGFLPGGAANLAGGRSRSCTSPAGADQTFKVDRSCGPTFPKSWGVSSGLMPAAGSAAGIWPSRVIRVDARPVAGTWYARSVRV